MFRKSSVIFAASLALLSTLDSATCFAAAAPAQQREDLERPRFLKKEIKRFVFTNSTTSRGGPDEASTSDLETLHDTLTSSSVQDLGPDATPTSATSAIPTTLSLTPSDNGQSSTSEVSLSSAGDGDSNREEFLALHPSTTTVPVSSTPPPSSTPNSGEGATSQSSIVPGGDLDGATASSSSFPSASAGSSDQSSVNEVAPQTTYSSAVEQSGNGATSSQLGSTTPSQTTAIEQPGNGVTSSQLDSTTPSQTTAIEQPGNGVTSSQLDSTTPSQTTAVEQLGNGVTSSQLGPATQSQTTAVEQLGNGVTSSQLGSTASPETTTVPSSATVSNSLDNSQDDFEIANGISSSVASEASVSFSGEQGLSTSGLQTPSSAVQQTSSQVETDKTQETNTLESSLSSEGAGTPPVTTSVAGSPSLVLPAGETTKSSTQDEADNLTGVATTATEGLESLPATTADVGSSAVIPLSGTTIKSSANDESDQLTSGGTTTTDETPLATPSAGGSLAAVPGDTIKTSAQETDSYSSPNGEATSGIPAASTNTDNEGSTNTNTVTNGVVPTTSGSGAGAITSYAAEPASSPVPPQSVPATATLGSETSPTTAISENTQPTLTVGSAAVSTAQKGEPVGSSASIALQPNPTHASSQVGAPAQTTLPDGAVVPNTAQHTEAATNNATPLVTPPASVSSAGGDENSSPNLNAASTEPASVFNPSVAAAASRLNTIPASIENPLASISGNSPLVLNPAFTSAASAVDVLPASIQRPDQQVSSAGSPNSASPVITGGSNTAGGGPETIAGATSSPVITGSLIGATASPGGGTESPVGTASVVGGSVSSVGGTESPVGTASSVGGTVPPVGATQSPEGTASTVGGSVSPVGATQSSVGGTASPVGGTESAAGPTASQVGTTGSVATGSPVGGTSSPVGGTKSPVATGSLTGETGLASGSVSPQASGESTAAQISGQNSQSSALGSGLPESGPVTTASNGEVIHGTPTPTPQSVTLESGIAGYSTQSNGKVVPISAAAGTGSTVSNGQIVSAATDQGASAQSPGPSETGAAAASIAAQSAAAVATQESALPQGPTTTPAAPPPQQFYGKGPYTQSPVGYDTSTAQPVPTSIVHGPSSTPSATQGHYFGPSNLPSNVPQILYQNGGPGSQPPNTRLINIAFRYPLNYLFVYNHTVSQQQIFYYIPLGICHGLEIDVSQIKMQSLRAWDTYEDVGYVTTLALAWIPEGLVDNLGLLVSTPVSRFYSNPDNSTAFLLSMINNAIPITGSNSTDGSSTAFGNIPADTTSAKTGGAPIGGDIGNSEHVRASSVGIGVGVACGAAAYGAAMFFVARRYKKRRQSHMRSPSMFSSPVMSHAGPDAGAGAALMSGAMGERSASPYYDNDGRAGSRGSGRSGSSRHQISAPVMAENSLGWN